MAAAVHVQGPCMFPHSAVSLLNTQAFYLPTSTLHDAAILRKAERFKCRHPLRSNSARAAGVGGSVGAGGGALQCSERRSVLNVEYLLRSNSAHAAGVGGGVGAGGGVLAGADRRLRGEPCGAAGHQQRAACARALPRPRRQHGAPTTLPQLVCSTIREGLCTRPEHDLCIALCWRWGHTRGWTRSHGQT